MVNKAILQVFFHIDFDLRKAGADSGNAAQANSNPHHITAIRDAQYDIEATFHGFNVLLQRLRSRLILPPRMRSKDWDLSRFHDVCESLHDCPQLTQFGSCPVQ